MLVENNAILTKDNLIKRNWVGSPTCHFCLENETIDHLFFACPVARITWGIIGTCLGTNTIPKNLTQYHSWITQLLPEGKGVHICGCVAVCWAIWKCRNKACFDKKTIKNPLEIIIHVCSFLTYWAGLYNSETQGKILEGVQALLVCASRLMTSHPSTTTTARLPPPSSDVVPEDEESEWVVVEC